MMTNAYKNVSNVVLVIQPAGMADRPALLLNAHFDSTLGSAGGWLALMPIISRGLRLTVHISRLRIAAGVTCSRNPAQPQRMNWLVRGY